MCGIVGCVGRDDAVQVVARGLRRLEYRGYDSAGLAYRQDDRLRVVRTAGRVDDLQARLPEGARSDLAVGHTRWATHGPPVEHNAHPHSSPDGRIVLVHNGIIDNYLELREGLLGRGARFASDTDSEIVAHLVAREYGGDLLAAVQRVMPKLAGTFALVVAAADRPGELVGARRGSPLAVGLGKGFTLLASDALPLVEHTQRVVFLEDEQAVRATAAGVELYAAGGRVEPQVRNLEWSGEIADKGGYRHFMLKEINEQPVVLERLVRRRVRLPADADSPPALDLEGVELPESYLAGISRIVLVAQGTAFHAAMVGRNMIERAARISAYPEYAADFRYRDPVIDPSVLVIAVTQSGETMDTLHAVRLARERGCRVLAVVNVRESSIAREADGVFCLECGPEIGVASTKAFTAMIAGLYVFALHLGRVRGTLGVEEQRRRARDLLRVGPRLEEVLARSEEVRALAGRYAAAGNFLFLGRGTGWPLALEGALKLKEVSYIHAEGYDAAEMKHGPIALIDENMPALFIALKGRRYDKVLGNIQEVKARKGRVIAVASHDDDGIAGVVDDVLRVRADSGIVNSIVCSIPLQLLAYHIADLRGCDVDKPKNLAKSVTVE